MSNFFGYLTDDGELISSVDKYDPKYASQWIDCLTDNSQIKLSVSKEVFNTIITPLQDITFAQAVRGYSVEERTKSGQQYYALKLIDHVDRKIYFNDRLIAFIIETGAVLYKNRFQYVLKPLYCTRFHKRTAMRVADKVVYCHRCKYVLTEEDIEKLRG